MQIFMFFTLGLLVFPSELAAVAGQGLFLSLVVMLVSRPAAVFLSLLFSRLAIREKHLISWVGLRGSVPIVLATFPLLAGLDANHSIFNLIFFTVLTSVLFQGTTIPPFARLTGVDEPFIKHRRYPIDFEKSEELDMQLVDLFVPYGSAVAGEPILNLGFPKESLITLISRGEKYIMPSGATVLQEGDVLLILGNRESLAAAQALLEKPKEKPKPSSAA
ncbi:MAG: K(+)/H(+) antiporter NhaP2 [bacterium ADurb.Bin478]|nr:MAG: K(+)/H(+) antiporter NhaP2 [bacterium ADurb.Bin478]